MKLFRKFTVILSSLLTINTMKAQELGNSQQTEISQRAELLYYSPIANGFKSISCELKLDWDTIPAMMLAPAEQAGKDHLRETKLHFTSDISGTQNITREYPSVTSSVARPAYDQFFDWASSVVGGFFMTWKSKAMRSPVPTGKYISPSHQFLAATKLQQNTGRIQSHCRYQRSL